MSDRPEITKMLSLAVKMYINPHNDPRIYWAKEVTFDNGTSNKCRVDFMRFIPRNNTVSGIEKGDFYCYEVKSSVEDFHSKDGHNFIGDFNYYVMLRGVFERIRHDIPYGIGVYCPDGEELICLKSARRRNRDRSVSEMLLMMFRSAAREARKDG